MFGQDLGWKIRHNQINESVVSRQNNRASFPLTDNNPSNQSVTTDGPVRQLRTYRKKKRPKGSWSANQLRGYSKEGSKQEGRQGNNRQRVCRLARHKTPEVLLFSSTIKAETKRRSGWHTRRPRAPLATLHFSNHPKAAAVNEEHKSRD